MPNLHGKYKCFLRVTFFAFILEKSSQNVENESFGGSLWTLKSGSGPFREDHKTPQIFEAVLKCFWHQNDVKQCPLLNNLLDALSREIGTDSQVSSKSRLCCICVVFVCMFFDLLFPLCCFLSLSFTLLCFVCILSLVMCVAVLLICSFSFACYASCYFGRFLFVFIASVYFPLSFN